jgi:hypothetical protein
MNHTSSSPGDYKFLAIGLATGLLAGAVLGVVFWIFWDSPRSFVVMVVLGVLAGLWHGRKLHLIDPDALKRQTRN